ncbi:MAG: GAF domain-containing protein, partial [Chloroflexi bacterium]|nr:GAF domain-containing protein [Chloroflexota bacterium]
MLVWIWENFSAINWGTVFFYLLFLAVVGLSAGWTIQVVQLKSEIAALRRTLKLDDSLLRGSQSLISAPNRKKAMKAFLEQFLQDCTGVFGTDVTRGSILTVTGKGQYLQPMACHAMPGSSIRGRRFYVGPSEDKATERGIAGEVYRAGIPRVVRFTEKNGEDLPSDPAYLKFDSRRTHSPYRSFIAVPIMADDEKVGVLCLDAQRPTTFITKEPRNNKVSNWDRGEGERCSSSHRETRLARAER